MRCPTLKQPFTRGFEHIHLNHAWFAWHPVVIGQEIVWWEWVYRKETGYMGYYEYTDYNGFYHREED